ncbi:MAG: N-acetylneuraminate synthase [Elusimicrobia bacterium]|nr:N-acetylneuraminate synthase [Elusimicrobiota bacterium]
MDFLPSGRPFVIAEAGVNHNGRQDLALRLVDAAAAAGADAVKFQTFRAEALACADAPKARYQRRGSRGSASQRDMLKALELNPAAHEAVLARCRRRRILFLSTPFDEESADFLERLGMKAFKLPSGEVTNPFLLAHVARKGRPVILSTGMSTFAEVRSAVQVLRRAGNRDLALLHCVSNYPAKPEDSNLRAMSTLAEAFKVPVGYSDHTPGIAVAVAAAALGARIIEKHFTLDKGLPGPDHAVSLDARELRDLVVSLRQAVEALGDGVKTPRPSEAEIRRVSRRSVVLARRMEAGVPLRLDSLAFKRPGTGIPPTLARKVVGRTLRRPAEADTLLRWDMLR